MRIRSSEEDLNYFGSLKYSMKRENITKVPFLSGFPCANPAFLSPKANSEAAVTQVTSSYFLFCFMVNLLCSQFPMAGGCKKALLAPCRIYIQGFRLIESTDKYRGGWLRGRLSRISSPEGGGMGIL